MGSGAVSCGTCGQLSRGRRGDPACPPLRARRGAVSARPGAGGGQKHGQGLTRGREVRRWGRAGSGERRAGSEPPRCCAVGSVQPRRLPPSQARRFRGDSARGAPGSVTFAIQSVSWVYCLPLLSHLPRRKPRPNGTARAQQDGAPGGEETRGQSPQLRSQPPPPPASRWDVLPTGSSGPTRGPAALCPAVGRGWAGGAERAGSGPAERGEPWARSRRPSQPHPGCPASPTRRRARLCHMAAAGREEEEPSQRKPHPSSRSRSCSQSGSILSPGLPCILLAQPGPVRAAQRGAKSVGTLPGAVLGPVVPKWPRDPPSPAFRRGLATPRAGAGSDPPAQQP